MAHTPGPWKVEDDTYGDRAFVRMSDGRTLATFGTSAEIGIGLDNARLIAAAPELLASLKEMRDGLAAAMRTIHESLLEKADIVDMFVDEMRAAGVKNGAGVRADAAIAKAEGR